METHLLKRAAQYIEDVRLQKTLRPRRQFYSFVERVRDLPTHGIGIHQTNQEALTPILKTRLSPHSHFYIFDPNQDSILQEDMQNGNWRSSRNRLLNTLAHTSWGKDVLHQNTSTVLFTAPRNGYRNGLYRSRRELPHTNDDGIGIYS